MKHNKKMMGTGATHVSFGSWFIIELFAIETLKTHNMHLFVGLNLNILHIELHSNPKVLHSTWFETEELINLKCNQSSLKQLENGTKFINTIEKTQFIPDSYKQQTRDLSEHKQLNQEHTKEDE